MRHGAALDWMNFFLADVRGGVAPYIGIFLLTHAQWDPAAIGLVLTIAGLLGIIFHMPIGALIDATRRKRALLVGGVVLLAICSVAIERAPYFPVVLVADIAMAVLGAVFAPTVAAITLGLVARHQIAARLGRNAAFDRAGNIFIAAFAGFIGWAFTQNAVFYLVPLFAIPSIIAILAVPARAIDNTRARGFDQPAAHTTAPAIWRALLDRRLLVLASAAALLHFANAPMLTLVGQKIALADPDRATLLMAGCIVVAQLVTIPVALLVGRRADRWGRTPFLIAACAVLALRGFLFAFADDPKWLVVVQLLDGIGFGVFETLIPLILMDIARDTGRYSVSRGLLGTVQGVGGSLSNVAAGVIVVQAGYSMAFVLLASVATTALLLVLIAMPETRAAPAQAPAEPEPAENPAPAPVALAA
ncbi:MAG TPA: MFS transporter [Alphaproteobacteria bacterium]|nr:MFS transporter [Alphaproteobacteria bacterium]